MRVTAWENLDDNQWTEFARIDTSEIVGVTPANVVPQWSDVVHSSNALSTNEELMRQIQHEWAIDDTVGRNRPPSPVSSQRCNCCLTTSTAFSRCFSGSTTSTMVV